MGVKAFWSRGLWFLGPAWKHVGDVPRDLLTMKPGVLLFFEAFSPSKGKIWRRRRKGFFDVSSRIIIADSRGPIRSSLLRSFPFIADRRCRRRRRGRSCVGWARTTRLDGAESSLSGRSEALLRRWQGAVHLRLSSPLLRHTDHRAQRGTGAGEGFAEAGRGSELSRYHRFLGESEGVRVSGTVNSSLTRVFSRIRASGEKFFLWMPSYFTCDLSTRR